jgi:uncharacterized protein DUF3108
MPEAVARHRVVLLALAASAAMHAAVFVSIPARFDAPDEPPEAAYSATLEAATAQAAPAPKPAAKPAPKRVHKPRPRIAPPPPPPPPVLAAATPQPELPQAVLPPPAVDPLPQAVPDDEDEVADAVEKEILAAAQPAAPVPALEPPKFPVDALPSRLSITYALTSSFADGRAVYEWSRDGDRYDITSEAQAVGFFTLFLEGRIRQESNGTVTPDGLRPERFVEHRPNVEDEGLEFDWEAKKVTFDRGSSGKRTDSITGNAVDWLSMIFQLAHVPPSGDAFDLQVFTQRKFYKFHLSILGLEEIEIPIGKVRALHLRHVDPEDGKEVDVWLGIDQHYLPVKLRYPVAKMRIMVEQSAARITER